MSNSPPLTLWRRNLANLPDYPLPPEYRLRLIAPGEVSSWVEVQQAAEPYLTMSEEWFWQEFGTPKGLAWERCFLLEESAGPVVGTITAWSDDQLDGRERGRVHWLAIRPEWQGRGLAKPMVSAALQLLSRHHDSAYLITQAERTVAIRLYEAMGFEPYHRPPNKDSTPTDQSTPTTQ